MDALQIRRRHLLHAAPIAVFGLAAGNAQAKGEKEVLAAEDLMVEHGVLRRALLVYSAAAARLRGSNAAGVPAPPLARTASLFRNFGEDYHERAVEEKYVFPAVEHGKGEAAGYPAILKAQHERGRVITDYISAKCGSGRIAAADAAALANVLDGFVLMYEHHAAIEDTVVFPAWKGTLSDKQYKEQSELFEQIEHKMIGKNGQEDAIKHIAQIEKEFGLSDLAALTAPMPPSQPMPQTPAK